MKSSMMKSHTDESSLTSSGEGRLLHEPTDGKRVWMPHPLLQSTIFAATRPDHTSQRIERINAFGDKIRIDSPRLLTTGTDLPVFLSTLALAQKNGIREGTLGGNTVCFTQFPIAGLYELLGVDRRNRAWLTQALYDIGRTSFLITYRDPEKHRGRYKWEAGQFWIPSLTVGQGRNGSTLQLQISRFLVPKPDVYLYAQLELVNALETDVAKGIFWVLICRESLRASPGEWQSLLGSNDRKLRQWRVKSFLPALEELATMGFSWRECEDGAVVVHRPGKKQKQGELMS